MFWSFDSFKEFIANLKYKRFLLYLYSHYGAAVVLLIPIVGVFLKRSIGWICLMSYFYFIFINFLFTSISHNFEDIEMFFVALIVGAVPILIFNRRGIYYKHYKINSNNILKINIYASLIGMIITLLSAYSRTW